MPHDKLAERIVAHLIATYQRHDGDDPRVWTGDSVSQIRWGSKTHIKIDYSGNLSNSLGGGRYSCSADLLQKITQAKTLVLSRGW